MHRTNIYLDEVQAARLDRIANEQGMRSLRASR